MKKLFLLAALLVSLLAARSAAAQDGTPPARAVTDDDVNRVARQLFCPVCENIPLDVCPTQACAQWRGTIREKLAAGWSDQQVLDYFSSQYGERVLAKPSSQGLTLFIWVIPPILILAGGAILWRFLRSSRAAQQSAPPPAPSAPADEYAQRLEQELRKRA
ncbi:MAG: cytochrome c-type biogenesis protein [Anaerolineales bacterium]